MLGSVLDASVQELLLPAKVVGHVRHGAHVRMHPDCACRNMLPAVVVAVVRCAVLGVIVPPKGTKRKADDVGPSRKVKAKAQDERGVADI